MQFDEVLDRTIQLLKRNRRMSIRALRRQFDIDEEFAADIMAELVTVLKVAVEEDGQVVAWIGDERVGHGGAFASSPQTTRGIEARQSPSNDAAATRAAGKPPTRIAEGERRFLTVMFCDLVDSTPLAEQLDQEDLADVYGTWHDASAEAIARFNGYVADYRGDGTLVYFGYPQAFEDSPHRAIRAALAMLERLAVLNIELKKTYDITLSVRVGIHSGFVLLSDLGGHFSRDQFALGETLNIAARLQSIAEPNHIVTSNITAQLVRGYFALTDGGVRHLKGVSRAISAFHVVAETSTSERLQTAGSHAARSFVAREKELEILKHYLAASFDGAGQTVLLVGDAGIGKSRLVETFAASIEGKALRNIMLRCSAYHTASALFPVVAAVSAEVGIDAHDPPDVSLGKLVAELTRSGSLAPERDARLIGNLLGLATDQDGASHMLGAQQRRTAALDAIVDWVIGTAAREPLLIIVEDFHWADPSTLELFELLQAAMGQSRICVLLTARSDFVVPPALVAKLLRIQIGPLSASEAERVIDYLLGNRVLPAELRSRIVARAEGIPLFLEELVTMILESDMLIEDNGVYSVAQPISTLPIPFTLQDLLAARLDSLGDARDTAQLAATFGRNFSFDQISAISALEEPVLIQQLAKLVDRDIVQCEGQLLHSVCRFRHALVQDAAYQSMLKGRRQQYHRAIARMLERPQASGSIDEPEILAHHFSEAGLVEPALGYWRLASESALQRSATTEALHHCDRGIGLAKGTVGSIAVARGELHLQLARGAALIMLKGQSAPEVAACYGHALELAEGLEDSREVFMVLFGLWRSSIAVGAQARVQEIAEQLLAIADRMGDLVLRLCALSTLALSHYHKIQFKQALERARAGVALYESMQEPNKDPLIFNMGQHPALACLNCIAFILQLTGYPDQSVAHQRKSEALAGKLAMPFQQATSCGWGMMIDMLRRDEAAARAHIGEVLGIADAHDFPFWRGLGGFHHLILQIEAGQPTDGVDAINAAIDRVLNEGGANLRNRVWALSALACARIGAHAEADHLLQKAFARIGEASEQWWEPELHNIQGQLILLADSSQQVKAEACFRAALHLAHAKGLQLFRLRAATLLVRHASDGARQTAAKEQLRTVLAEFSEGFATRDLHEALALVQMQ